MRTYLYLTPKQSHLINEALKGCTIRGAKALQRQWAKKVAEQAENHGVELTIIGPDSYELEGDDDIFGDCDD